MNEVVPSLTCCLLRALTGDISDLSLEAIKGVAFALRILYLSISLATLNFQEAKRGYFRLLFDLFGVPKRA